MLLYTPPTTSSVPVVDLGPSFSGRERDRSAVADEIHKACRDTGFFYIANHAVAPDLIARACEASREFFALPEGEKRALTMIKGEPRGYEHAEFQVLDDGSPADLKESFSLAADAAAGDLTLNATANQWPQALPGFRQTMLAYHGVLSTLAAHVASLIATSLDMPADFFVEGYRRANPTLRLLRYPPQPAGAAFNQLGAGAHTDWGGITLLHQDDAGGLEVQTAEGTWLRAEPIADTFIVNLGDLMQRWTNDLYHSTLHRVMNNRAKRDRYSMAFFYSPSFHTRVACLPTCVQAGEQPHYEPCTAGEHIHQRRLTTYGIA
jgi:isopenicillin N synthase-like dioxygenase